MNLGAAIARGNTADIYLWEGKAVKVFHEGLRVPRVFEVGCVGGRQAIVMEYVEGVPLGALMQQGAEGCLALSVALQREMHAKDAAGLEPMKDKLRRQLQGAAALDAACRAGLLERLERMPVKSKLCHGEYHLYNLLRCGGKTVVIDWVEASAGSPCADVYRSYLLYLQSSAALAERYLRMYCEGSGVSRGEVLAWGPIVSGARLSENVSAEGVACLLSIVNE